jgi:low temperature requirement protein LtrA
MTFIETFLATSTTLFCAWIFKTYIEPRLNNSHKKIKKVFVKKKRGLKHGNNKHT